MTPTPLPSHVGRYEVIDRLGAGGMGVVYVATDPLLRRTVAIKVLPAGDDELRERFGREARAAAGLRHNNVVTIYDVGEHDGQPFIAMEFLDGESMAEMIQRKASLSLERRLQLMIDLCAGLGHAHRSGIIHRDIKPGNLMITTEGSLKVLDFGLVRLTGGASHTGLTRAGSVMGTPHYMSPEQVDGGTVDQRSDIFSVGLVLYELLSYQKAYSGDSALIVLHNILHKTPTPIRSLMPSIDPELEGIVGKGLEKVPSERYQALSSLAADLIRVRTRLMKEIDASTQIRPRQAEVAPVKFERDDEPTAIPTPRNIRNLDALAQRRAAQIELHMLAAAKHFTEGSYEAAIAECENAIVFNPQEARALDLLDRAHHAIEDVQVERWLGAAKALLDSGELTAAEALIDQSLKLRADSDGAQALQREVREKRRERERTAERLRAAVAAVERAQTHLNEGALDAAARCASEALGYDPGNGEAISLKERALAAIADRRREQDRDLAARTAAQTARLRADSGDADGALGELRAFAPPHPVVTEIIAEFETRLREERAAAAAAASANTRPIIRESSPPPPLDPRALAGVPLQARSRQSGIAPRKPAVAQPTPQPPRKRWPLVAALGVVVALVGVGMWSFRDQPQSPPIETGKRASSSSDEAVVNGAWDQYRKGDASGAIATVLTVPESTKDARRLLEMIRRDAEARALAARNNAVAAERTTVEQFGLGIEKQNEAQKVSSAAKDTARAVALFDEAATLFTAATNAVLASTPPDFTARLRDASRAFENGDYARSISLYRSILAGDPDNSEAAQGLKTVTRAQETERKYVGGEVKALPLTAEQTRQLAGHLANGQKQQSDGEYDSAIASYEAALRIDPKNARAANGLGETRKAQAAEAGALKLLKKPGA